MAATTISTHSQMNPLFKQKPKLKRKEKNSSYIIIALGFIFSCSLILYFHTVLLETQANKQQQEIISIKEQNYKLSVELAEMKTLPTIDKKAYKMGMKPAKNIKYIVMPSQFFTEAPEQLKYTKMEHSKPRRTVGL